LKVLWLDMMFLFKRQQALARACAFSCLLSLIMEVRSYVLRILVSDTDFLSVTIVISPLLSLMASQPLLSDLQTLTVAD